MISASPVRVGTSGWSYRHWKGPFYPVELPDSAWLDFYARHFRTVEIDSSFYRLPDERTLCRWRNAVPPDFVFAVKASRYITHMKKLKDPGLNIPLFLRRIEFLGEKLGPILFQLPAQMGFNEERLRGFLQVLPPQWRYVFEFRNPNWHVGRTFALLREHQAAFCIYELDGRLSPREVTADFVYVRLHGPDGPYRGQYDNAALENWAATLRRWSTEGKDCYCYFDNDQCGYAVQDAHRLGGILGAREIAA